MLPCGTGETEQGGEGGERRRGKTGRCGAEWGRAAMASNGKQWIPSSQGLGGRLESTCTFSVVLGTATFQWIRDMWFQSGSFLQHSTASSHPSPAPDDLCPHCRRLVLFHPPFLYVPTDPPTWLLRSLPILSASLLLLLHHQCVVCIESQYLNNDSKDTHHHHHHHHAVNAAVSIKPHRYTPTHPFLHLPHRRRRRRRNGERHPLLRGPAPGHEPGRPRSRERKAGPGSPLG